MYLKNRFIVYQFELLHANKLRLASKHSDWPVSRERSDRHRRPSGETREWVRTQDSGRCIRIGVILICDSFTATNVTTLGVMTTLAKLTHQKNIVYFIPRGIKFAPTLYFKLDDAE